MEITYIGHSCFMIKGSQLTVVTDPYDPKIGLKEPKLSCDVVTISHDHFDHNYIKSISGHRLVINGPGEYELSGSFIYGYPSFHDDKNGEERGKNTIYSLDIDGFTVVHLGDLGHLLDKDTLEKLPNVDVLLIPVGGTYTIDAKTASKIIASLEPYFVIPMHYSVPKLMFKDELLGVDKFLNEMGVEEPKKMSKFVLNKKADLDSESEVIVLNPTN